MCSASDQLKNILFINSWYIFDRMYHQLIRKFVIHLYFPLFNEYMILILLINIQQDTRQKNFTSTKCEPCHNTKKKIRCFASHCISLLQEGEGRTDSDSNSQLDQRNCLLIVQNFLLRTMIGSTFETGNFPLSLALKDKCYLQQRIVTTNCKWSNQKLKRV